MKSDIIITQTTQGQKRLLVDEGDFISLHVSALNFLTTMSMTTTSTAATLFGLFQPFLSIRLHPSDKPRLPREQWQVARNMGVGERESR